jgi:hypothetical protein
MVPECCPTLRFDELVGVAVDDDEVNGIGCLSTFCFVVTNLVLVLGEGVCERVGLDEMGGIER